jgi:hypothetical protein
MYVDENKYQCNNTSVYIHFLIYIFIDLLFVRGVSLVGEGLGTPRLTRLLDLFGF